MLRFHLTKKSSNGKTGPIPVSTSTHDTCPPSCPFAKEGCYAEAGKLSMHWRKVTEGLRGGTWEAFLGEVRKIKPGSLWRHNQAGDLPGLGETVDAGMLAQLVDAQAGRRGFTYTHKPMTDAGNAAAVRAANAGGFTVNLSANNLAHADSLAALDVGPVVAVVPESFPDKGATPGGLKVTVCPAQVREDVTCATCGLCAIRDRKGLVVAFRAHGPSKRKAERASIAAVVTA